MLAIFQKELKSYFNNMLGYVFIAVISLLIGIYFMANNMVGGYPYFAYSVYGCSTIILFTFPIITMKVFSEENKSKTDQMLLTAPVKLWQIVLGKFLAMAVIYAIPLLISCLCPLIIKLKGTHYYFKGDYLAILTLFMLGLVMIALGEFISSLTESMIIAAVGSFLIVFLVAMWSSLTGYIPSTNGAALIGIIVLAILLALIIYGITKNKFITFTFGIVLIIAALITYLVKATAIRTLFDYIIDILDYTKPLTYVSYYSIMDLSGILKYISTIFIFLMLTVQVLHKRRWN